MYVLRDALGEMYINRDNLLDYMQSGIANLTRADEESERQSHFTLAEEIVVNCPTRTKNPVLADFLW